MSLYIGVDECARGPIFGRLYCSAVILNPCISVHPYIKDSKKLKPSQRAIARKYIEKTAIEYVVVYIEPDEIDKINIRQANLKAFNSVLKQLKTKVNQVYIDGNDFVREKDCPYSKDQIETVIKGDSKYINISAASILAKEHHDEYIRDMCKMFPDLDQKYGLLSNMGYGTKKHIEGIRKYGLSPFHRLTFNVLK